MTASGKVLAIDAGTTGVTTTAVTPVVPASIARTLTTPHPG